RVDKFITDSQPWKLAKDPSARLELETVISTAYEALRHIVLIAAPVLPFTTKEIWSEMGLSNEPLSFNPNDARWGESIDTGKVEKITPAFPKLQKDKIMAEIEKERGPAAPPDASASPAAEAGPEKAAPTAVAKVSEIAGVASVFPPGFPPLAPTIAIDDFVKVDLRVATVLEAERVPKADKLLKLLVDTGESQPRQILAGIAMHYTPEQMIGRKIIVVANLAPRKLRGFESNGMLLAASVGEDGRPVLATFAEDVPNGARLK
ncbi:MAG TPA: methionine--tRNA ligase subunit beta, partial [Blastocatellia bacterium]|nr:methionine--tRNA ligase subunit beta [Blastocatellia bacterium]